MAWKWHKNWQSVKPVKHSQWAFGWDSAQICTKCAIIIIIIFLLSLARKEILYKTPPAFLIPCQSLDSWSCLSILHLLPPPSPSILHLDQSRLCHPAANSHLPLQANDGFQVLSPAVILCFSFCNSILGGGGGGCCNPNSQPGGPGYLSSPGSSIWICLASVVPSATMLSPA